MALVTSRIEVEVPDGAQVGDEFRLSGAARVVLIREHLITVRSGTGADVRTLPGEREYELLVVGAELESIT